MTRLIRVHGYYGPLLCIFVQGHLSRGLAPPTRPPARSLNGRLGSGDLHPIRLMSVPACHPRTESICPTRYTSLPRSDPVYSGRRWPVTARPLRPAGSPPAFPSPFRPPSLRLLATAGSTSVPFDPRSAPSPVPS